MPALERSNVLISDQWDLSKLYKNELDWEEAFRTFEPYISNIATLRGSLGSSVEALSLALSLDNKAGILLEPLSYYAMLRLQEDLSNTTNGARYARLNALSARYAEASSYIIPEIQAIDQQKMASFLTSPLLVDDQISLRKLLRYKEHTLSVKEESLLAGLSDIFNTPDDTFSALTDADMNFGTISTEKGTESLSQASFSLFLKNRDRTIRQKAYTQFYSLYDSHKNSIASLYAGSIKQDIYQARVRNFKSARHKALFADNVEDSVYDNLVSTVRSQLPILHRYYAVRKKILKLEELRHYDLHVPLFNNSVQTQYNYEQGVSLICDALKPLGTDYVETMREGLLGRWVDRYENRGKSSGAFSAGSYRGDPYILMNYKSDDIRSLFTLAHEAGHSMHSYYSVANNPFQHYNYTIFEAEVASTFNEALLFEHLLKTTHDPKLKCQLIASRLDDMVSTLFRQTMFAEFEQTIHHSVEQGEAASIDLFRSVYRSLLKDYLGPNIVLEDISDLEALRIPHFYRAFYVYKYATGISASIALSQKVLSGGAKERSDYLSFLKSGGSRWPLENLALGGVDMSNPEAIKQAINLFSHMLSQIELSYND